ncbi:MAG: ACP S-malonyltransferase [Ruminococcus sp.]|nr:ACP S-malonyltransferase [Ruminococcus sp.]
MNNLKRAFLFNAIGSRPEKLLVKLPPELMDRYTHYFDVAFDRLGLNKDIEKNTGYDVKVAEWIVPLLTDRVVFEYYIEKGIIPDIGAGYSSGIVSISACFGSMRHEDAHDLMMSHRSMFRSLKEHGLKLDMGVIIGFSYDDLSELLNGHFTSDELMIGSGNSSFHVMICGKAEAVNKAIELALNEGAIKAFSMGTETAFHNPIIEAYSQEHMEVCRNIQYKDPKYPIISVFDHNIMTTAEEVKRENLLNITTPIRWDIALKKLEESGVKEFFDVSSNGAVHKFSRVSRKCKIYTLEDVFSGNI